MAGIITDLSLLTLNVNGLNSPSKRHHLANWIKKEEEEHLVYKRPTLLPEIYTGLE
jgi:hypothetical protein